RRNSEIVGTQRANTRGAAGGSAYGLRRLCVHGIFSQGDVQEVRARTQREPLVLAARRNEAPQEDSPALSWRHAQRFRKNAPLRTQAFGRTARLLRSHVDAHIQSLERLRRLQRGNR